MSKEVWYKADRGDWDDRLPLITAAIESGVDYVLVDKEDVEKVRELGDVGVAAFVDDAAQIDDGEEEVDADVLVVGKHGEGDGTVDFPPDLSGSSDIANAKKAANNGEKVGNYVIIRNKEYERLAARAGNVSDYVVVIGEDWKIIPLENLIADLQTEETRLIAGVDSADEAETAFETLEVGTDGVLLDTDDPGEIKEAVEVRDEYESEEIDLSAAEVTRVETSEMGDRVCVDTSTLMEHGEGMLVGSMSNGLFLIHAETAESPYVASRPFRVNAGGVHAYIRVPGGDTKYLSELEAGDEVLVVDDEGNTREALVGRSKIEKRPMILVEAEVNGERYRTLVQNAETIKLTTPDGPKPVTELEEGDEVLIYVEEGGRHFGTKVEESVVEK
ncbi:MAG: 3-dehydroquinate synthase II [Halobacteria archaeon]|nr:3-dehydroquinate synthase II [Halobacteria archaeon]